MMSADIIALLSGLHRLDPLSLLRGKFDSKEARQVLAATRGITERPQVVSP